MSKSGLLVVVAFLALCVHALAQDALEEGKQLLSAKKYEAAIEKFEAVLEESPESFEARLGAGRAYHALGDPDTANFHAVKAEKLRPESVDAAALVGDTFVGMGDTKRQRGSDPTASYEEAVTSFRRVAKLEPKEARYHERLGYLYFWMSRPADSAAAYAAAAELAPKDPAMPYLAARSYQLSGEQEKAVSMVDKAIKTAPGFAPYHLLRGQLCEQQKKLGDAAGSYLKALTTKELPEGEINAAAGGIWRCFADAKDWKAMQRHFSSWTKKASKVPTSWWWLGYSQLQAQDFKAALKSYKKMDKVAGGNWPEAPYYMGVCLRNLGKTEAALKALKRAGSMEYAWQEPNSPVTQIRIIIGEAVSRGDLEEAIRIGETYALPVAGDAMRIWVLQDLGFFYRDSTALRGTNYGSAKSRAGFEKSREYYKAAVAEIPNHPELTATQKAQLINDYGLMLHYYDLKDIEGAIKHYQEALGHDPSLPDSCLNYGLILFDLGKLEESLAVLNRSAEDRQDIVRMRRRVRAALKREDG